MAGNNLARDGRDVPAMGLYDPSMHRVVSAQAVNAQEDSASGEWYGTLQLQDQVRAAILAGQAFVATTGSITAVSSNTFGAGIWHDKTNKNNIFVYSCRISNNGGSSMAYLYIPTADPALGGNLTVTNASGSGSTSAITTATYATTAASVAGNLLETAMVPQSQGFELLPSGLFFAAGIAGGLVVYDYIANAAVWAVTMRWIEY
jgi:hypothetical protein